MDVVGNLAEAIELSRATLVLVPLGHADRASTQNRLTEYLKTKNQKHKAHQFLI